jgi:hypothetical protein
MQLRITNVGMQPCAFACITIFGMSQPGGYLLSTAVTDFHLTLTIHHILVHLYLVYYKRSFVRQSHHGGLTPKSQRNVVLLYSQGCRLETRPRSQGLSRLATPQRSYCQSQRQSFRRAIHDWSRSPLLRILPPTTGLEGKRTLPPSTW